MYDEMNIPAWKRDTLVRVQRKAIDSNEIVLTFIDLIAKDNFMQMLLHLNQDFDDDLLQDAIDLLI